MPNDSISSLLQGLTFRRETIAANLTLARSLEGRAQHLRLAARDASAVELQLAEIIAEIRGELREVVDLLEQDSGEKWTAGLRAQQFAKELTTAKAHLSAATVIWGRIGFLIDQISAAPNDGKEEPPTPAIVT